MPIVNVTTAGTRVQLASRPGSYVRVTIERKSANTGAIFIGLPVSLGAFNVGSGVSSTVYDMYLDASNPSVTIGLGSHNPAVDPMQIWLDAAVSGEGVSFFTE